MLRMLDGEFRECTKVLKGSEFHAAAFAGDIGATFWFFEDSLDKAPLFMVKKPKKEEKVQLDVGTKVTIRKDLETGESYGNMPLMPGMAAHRGRTTTIKAVKPHPSIRGFFYQLEGIDWSWSAEMFE